MTKPDRFDKILNVRFSSATVDDDLFASSRKFVMYDEAATKPANIITIPGGHDAETTFASLATIAPIVSSIGVYALRDFEVRGLAFIFKDGKIVDEPDLIPAYVRHDVDRGHQLYLNAELPVRTIEGPAVAAISNAHKIYGHWLLDIIPKVWISQNFLGDLSQIQLILPSGTPEFALTILRDFFGISRFLKHDIDCENLAIKQVFVPSLIHNDHYFHPALNDFVDYLLQHPLVSNSSHHNDVGEKLIYITRRNYRSNSTSYQRNISNEDEVFALMLSHGFKIISPEEMSWQDQICLFEKARVIVGEDGSALHNALFSKPETSVVCLNPANHVQISIAALRNQFIITQCSPKEDSQNGSMYRIDIERLHEAVVTAISAAGLNPSSP